MAQIIPFRHRPGAAWSAALRLFWNGSLNRLGDYLTLMQQELAMSHDLKIDAPIGQPFLTMTRTFNAPRALVWKALSEPEHAVRWWGPNGYSNEVLEFDFRVGGKWRIRTTTPDTTIEFFGDYVEIEKPNKITQTFSFDHLPPGAHSLDTVVLEERDGKTIYHAISSFSDVESRDAMVASGMQTGVVEGFERLDAMLEDWTVSA